MQLHAMRLPRHVSKCINVALSTAGPHARTHSPENAFQWFGTTSMQPEVVTCEKAGDQQEAFCGEDEVQLKFPCTEKNCRPWAPTSPVK